MSWPSNTSVRDQDVEAGIEVTDAFEPFEQRNDIFTRAFWDDSIRTKATDAFFASYRMEAIPRRGAGFSQKDFALRNASWLISDIVAERSTGEGRREGYQSPVACDTPVAAEVVPVDDPSAMSHEIKRVARFFGADLCGVTDFDDRWLYTSRVDTRDMSTAPHNLPDGLRSVIVLGHQMEESLVATYPSALAGAATGRD